MVTRLGSRWMVVLLWFAAGIASPLQADVEQEAIDILQTARVSSGLIVHLGCGDGRLTVALRRGDAIQVQGLTADADAVAQARARTLAAGAYGNITFHTFAGTELPYVDNLINLVVAEQPGQVRLAEMLRVLVPHGVALIREEHGGWQRVVKPRPSDIDEWSHYLHDATGNSVAHDDVVGPPRHLQWVGSPRWSRHHDRMASMSALVSTGGRMFYVMDEGSRVSIQLPPKWKLIARDAFNGSVLWKRDIEHWQSHLWPLKSGPSQLARRLVSTDDTVYVTLGFNAPLAALDAATGETRQTYPDTDATEEIITTNGRLFVVVRKGTAELGDYAPLHGTVGDQARSRQEFFWNEEPRVLMAFDAESGRRLWSRRTVVSPLSLAADGTQLFFHNGERLISLQQESGEVAWETQPVTRRQGFNFNFGPRLVVYKDLVLYAGGDGKMISVNAKSGKQLWSAEFPNSGYQSPQDLMVVDDLVWLAPLTSGKDTGVYRGRDPWTGEVKREFAPDVDTYWFHHRCYIAKGTNNYLIPSRTGIEFVDPDQQHWDINHWVRGGCLYGVMPCNGLTYAPPHNCACYPEAKLFGFNALAPAAATRALPDEIPEAKRLVRGPAYDRVFTADSSPGDWPTYRGNAARTGAATQDIATDFDGPKWSYALGGRITPPVIAAGKVLVSRIDRHTLYALDETSGEPQWTFTAGARIDSPPTIHAGRAVFGAADGWVYCLAIEDGELVWQYQAAPADRRTMAYEQVESLWPVHGSVLIRDDTVYCVAGRSNFLDGGLRLVRLRLGTGEKLSETVLDETNPETGNNLQELLQVLQMPVGLPDILSSDDKFVYMKSQKFDLDGNRLEIGPNSGQFAEQASKQRGEAAHLFAPMGFLDDSWFHREYWVLGQSFAGGHGGYYQAGKYAPSGRILVMGDGNVYGYGRKPQYLRWTTVLEHQLFAASAEPPEIPANVGGGGRRAAGGSYAEFGKGPNLDPTGKPLTVEAWVTATRQQGVIVARGGPSEGFALCLQGGRPAFLLRSGGNLTTVVGPKRIVGGWHHVVGVLRADKSMQLHIDGQLVAEGQAGSLIQKDPAQGLEVGLDAQSAVGEYPGANPFTGIIDEVRLYFSAFDAERIAARYRDGSELGPNPVLVVTFDDGTARDRSVHRHDGTLHGGKVAEGRIGKGIQFSGGRGPGNNQVRPGDSLVSPTWAHEIPIYVRGMLLAGKQLFVAGPPDIMDEEETFKLLAERDQDVLELLWAQDRALNGADGGWLMIVDTATGEVKRLVELDTIPAWDGLAGANGRLFLSTLDGRVLCFGN